jgi:hypothetical protein
MGTLADQLEVPVTKASRGLPPPSHFPARFRYNWLTALVTVLRAMPGARRVAQGNLTPRPPQNRT